MSASPTTSASAPGATTTTTRDPGRPAGPEHPAAPFPILLQGQVVKGFGRGSKDLGIPTANLPEAVATHADEVCGLQTGIYYGWACVLGHPDIAPTLHGMVMSFGWNPYYRNERRTAEVHILHAFGELDFYGAQLCVVVAGWLREERNYPDLQALIADINLDIAIAASSLARPAYMQLRRMLVEVGGCEDAAAAAAADAPR